MAASRTRVPPPIAGLDARSLERLFASSPAPEATPAGRFEGDWLAVTAPLLGGPARLALRVLGPWRGKRFDGDHDRGTNVVSPLLRRAVPLLSPRAHPTSRAEPDGALAAVPFVTAVGPGRLPPHRPVLFVDYDVPANTAPVRRLLDELVEPAPGVLLGQALLRTTGTAQRWAWFALWRRDG
jgi:hypothetical protein